MTKLVRLTVETNLLTSTYMFEFDEKTIFTNVLASVGIVSLVVFIIFPVSGPQITVSSVVDII